MAQEIERKFLVKGDFKSQSTKSTRITQGYLSSIPEEQYVLELKGIKGILRLKVLVMQAEPVALNGRKKFLYVKWKIF